MRHFTLLSLNAFLVGVPWLPLPWLVSPWAQHEHDGQRLLQVLLVWILACVWLIRSWTCQTGAVARPIDDIRGQTGVRPLGWLALAVGVVLSAGLAKHPLWAALELLLIGGMAWVAWTIAITTTRQQTWVWAACLSGAAVFSLTTVLASLVGLLQGISPQVVDSIPGYSNIRHWNHVQVAAIPLMVGAVWRWVYIRPVAWAGRLGVVACVALLWTTGGRSASIALVGGAIVVWAVLGRKAHPLLRSWAGYVVAGVLLGLALLRWLPAVLHVPMERLLLARPITPTTESARLELWSRAWGMAMDHPWLGVGPMHFANQPNPVATHPHNIYLQLMAEWGFPLGMAALVGVLYAMWRIGRRLRLMPAEDAQLPQGIVLWWGCLAVLIDGLFSGNFVMPMSQVWIATLFGLTWAWWRSGASQPSTHFAEPKAVMRSGLVVWCLLCSAALAWTVVMFEERKTEYPRPPSAWIGQVLDQAPRYWTVGWFD
jgi:O-antigen ligase